MAAITTHDLPTVAGLWSGSDLEDQRRIGLTPHEEGFRDLRNRLTRAAGLQADDSPAVAVERAYAALSLAGSAIAVANLDDAQVVPERTNMPGTTGQWPNWSLALPQPIEELESAPLANAISADLSRRNV
jgi:4-alpha-glucanotransferase